MPSPNADERIAMLADRLAVCLVVLKQRYGTDWEPWFGEGIWEDEDTLADEIRDWPEFKEAKGIVRVFIKRLDSRIREREKEYERELRNRELRGDQGAQQRQVAVEGQPRQREEGPHSRD